MSAAPNFWASVLRTALEVSERVPIAPLMKAAEKHRWKCDYNTGSIAADEALYLAAIAQMLQAKVIIEVGTFIGTSTMALASADSVEAIYTCDSSNDCLPSGGVIHTFPKQTSTVMLSALVKRQVRADLCFFDGHLSDKDAELLLRLTGPDTVFTFHDYHYGPKIRKKKGGGTFMETLPRKGIGGVRLLQPLLPHHVLAEPMTGTTVAALVPKALA